MISRLLINTDLSLTYLCVQNLAKLGIQQSNNPLSALGSILKRNSTGRGSLPRKSSKKLFDSPQSSPKTKKKPSVDAMRFGSEPPESKSPKMGGGLFKGLRRSTSRSKKKNGDEDSRSETGSLLSLPIHSALDEHSEEPVETKPKTSPMKTVTVPSSTPSVAASTANEPITNGDRSPPRQVTTQRVPLRVGGSTSAISSHRKTTDSAIFKEETIESLFSSESLFDSSEFDKILGKKKEKTPERALDDALPTEKKETVSEEKDKVAPLKNSVSESTVRSNGYLAGNAVLPNRPDRKKSADSTRRSIKDQLHRYESNSKVSKEEPLDSTPEVPAESESSKEEDVSDSSGGKDAASLMEKKERNVQTVEEESAPTIEEETPKVTEASANSSLATADEKLKSDEDVPTKKEEPAKKVAAGLFEDIGDEGDDLFKKKPSSSSKDEGSNRPKAKKKATLFSDDEDVEEEEVKKPTEKTTKPKDDNAVVREPLKPKDDNAVVREPLKPKDDNAVVSEPLGVSTEPKEKKKKSSLFDDIDFEEPPLFKVDIRSRRRAGRGPPPEDDDKKMPVEKKETARDVSKASLAESLKPDPKKDGGSKDDEEDTLFSPSRSPAKDKKKSSLFDDIDFEEPPLFKVNIRSRRRAGRGDPPHEEDDEVLFGGSKSKPKADAVEDEPAVVEATPNTDIDTPAATASVVDKEETNAEETQAQDSAVGADISDQSTTDILPTEPSKEDVPSEKPVKLAPKPARKPVVPNKPGTGGQTKPSWMAELKKRKQEKEGDAPGSPQKKTAEVPEWRKRALEREKKKEAGKSTLAAKKDVSKSPNSLRKSPLSARKTDSEKKSPITTRRRKSPTRETADVSEESTPKKEEAGKDDGESPRTSKTRREREREAKELEEKAETTEVKSRRETEAKEQKEKPDETDSTPVKSTYKTRREREREAKEKEEKEKSEGVTKSPYVTRKEREASKLGGKGDVEERPRYKTRREREREAREKEEKEAREKEEKKSKEKETKKEDDVKVESPYKTRRQREKEEQEKEAAKEGVKETGTYETRYKARRERARAAKEKEEQEKLAKEKEEQEKQTKEKEQDTEEKGKKEDKLSASSSTSSVKDSPARPALKKKPSIEIISRIRSGSKSSDTGGEDVKSPLAKSSLTDNKSAETDKKQTADVDDDVFTRDGLKSPSHIEALRTTSPRLSIELVTSRPESPKVQHDSEPSSSDALDVKIEDFEKATLTSPQTRSGASSAKSSVSSERDLNETRPFRSHTISSRSPTPPGTGPLKLSDSVPEWKKKLMDKKRTSGSSPVHKAPPVKIEQPPAEDKLPPWKKELLAKKMNRGDIKVCSLTL